MGDSVATSHEEKEERKPAQSQCTIKVGESLEFIIGTVCGQLGGVAKRKCKVVACGWWHGSAIE